PTVSGISPDHGPASGGTLVTITGTGFVDGATVTALGYPVPGLIWVSSTTMTAVTPAAPFGLLDFGMIVTNPDGQSVIVPTHFTFDSPPTVTAVSPIGGALAGGTAVTISGTNFVATPIVTFGGVAATSVVLVSGTSLTVVTPIHIAGTVNVVVTNPDTQVGTGTALFTYAPAPTVTAVSPSGGSTSGGASVTVTGTGFVNGASVTFDGIIDTSLIWVSATSLTVVTPADAAGPDDVVVINPDMQTGTLTNGYTYAPAPTVSGISPDHGPASGGTLVTITGTGFVDGATVTALGYPVPGLIWVSSTTMTAVTPAAPFGLLDFGMIVTNPDGQSVIVPTHFTFDSPPTVTAVSPIGGALAGRPAVTISGTNFVATPIVPFGGVAATSVVLVSGTSLTVVTPIHIAGTVNVVVTNPDTQVGTGTALFTYAPAPTVTAVSPSGGSTSGGASVTVTGTGFVNGASVTFDGIIDTSLIWVSATSLTVVTPAHAAGIVNVVVTNPDTQVGTGTALYTYAPAPTVTGFTPTHGPASGGTLITITGTGFVDGATGTINGILDPSLTWVSSTTMTILTTPTPVGLLDVVAVLTNPDGQSVSLATRFTFDAPPTVTAISPIGGALAGGTSVTISGTNFVATPTVTFGGVAATSVVWVSG